MAARRRAHRVLLLRVRENHLLPRRQDNMVLVFVEIVLCAAQDEQRPAAPAHVLFRDWHRTSGQRHALGKGVLAPTVGALIKVLVLARAAGATRCVCGYVLRIDGGNVAEQKKPI